jgi:50S ribosomal protein L16 3-hydroxylase
VIFEQSQMSKEQFLDEYWQRRPLLIRQALPDFQPTLDADDIAGLACDELAESRLVTGSFPAHDWSVRYGPFSAEDFATLPASCWTLLVQDVEKHYPPLQKLLRHFDFIPGWRIDDLMISVAGPGGSVGPHVDQYDVFLLQAAGRRRWQLAESFQPELVDGCELKVLRNFKPERDWTVERGDILYLPPGIAHHGVALDDGMTWSVGMRAPSSADLLQSLGDWLAVERNEGGRYLDPPLETALRPGELDSAAIENLSELCRSATENENDFREFCASFLSRFRQAHEPAPPENTTSPGELKHALGAGAVLRKSPWSRLLWHETESGARLFASGYALSCPLELATAICDCDRLAALGADLRDDDAHTLCQLINRGHLYIETPGN